MQFGYNTAALRRAMGLAALAICGGTVGAGHAATLTVGPAGDYPSIATAVAASHDGDVLLVAAGTYVNDFAEIRTKITLQASGGRVRMKAMGYIQNGKAILITDTDATITGFTFTGATVSVADGANGAGIRYQGGNLVLNDCYVLANQEGLLANPTPNGTITIKNSEFYHNGMATGPSAGYTHNLYVGAVAKLDVESSYFHDAIVGHEIKSRAAQTIVNNTRIAESASGTASYSIDFPNGGVVSVTGSQIEQGPSSENPVMISFGEEGGLYAGSSLDVQKNVVVNLLSSPSVLAVNNPTSLTVRINDNQIYDLTNAQIVSGPAALSGNSALLSAPTIPTNHPWNP
jgi:hypothetical protein